MNRYPVTQEQIDNILSTELKGVKFTTKPIYNSRIRNNGQTTAEIYPWGTIKFIKIQIGKQDTSKHEFLIDTLIHEELEARIFTRNAPFYQKLNQSNDIERHKFINRVIGRYFKMKGWKK